MTKKRLLYALLSLVLLITPWTGGTGLTLLLAFVPLLFLQLDLEPARAVRRAEKAKLRGLPKNERKAAKKAVPHKKHAALWVWMAVIFAIWWAAPALWVGRSTLVAPVPIILFGSALCTGAFMLYDLVWRKAPKALAYTVLVTAWISYELLYINGELSFPWLTLGGGFANDVKLIQWYEYTGMLGGSLWVLVCNLLIFEALRRRKSAARAAAAAAAVVLPIVASVVIYAGYKEPARPVTVKVIQPNIDPYKVKFTASEQYQNNIFLGLMARGRRNADYIVLPETALEGSRNQIYEESILESPYLAQLYQFVQEESPASTLVVGAMTYRFYDDSLSASATARRTSLGDYYDVYNTAIFLSLAAEPVVHHKSILVAGAEKLPFYNITKHLDFLVLQLGGVSGQYGMDSVRTVHATPAGVGSGAAICYESIYGEYFTEFVRGGAEVMFVITNDGWWGDTWGHRNHFSYSRLRAIENRRGIARSANTGISGFIDQRGEVLDKLGWNEQGALDGQLNLNDRITFYTRFGDVAGRLSVYVLALCILYFIAYRFKKRRHLTE